MPGPKQTAGLLAPEPHANYHLQPMPMKKQLPFGLSWRAVIGGALVVVVFFSGTLWALNTFFPSNPMHESRPSMTGLHPMAPVTRSADRVLANLASAG